MAPPVVLDASVVPAFGLTTIGLVDGLLIEVLMVTVEAGDAARVTVIGCGTAARAADVEVCRLQFTVIAVAETLTPAANIGLVKMTSASRVRMTLDLSTRKYFIGSSCFL